MTIPKICDRLTEQGNREKGKQMADDKKKLPPKKEEAKKNERIAKVVKKVLKDERPYPDKDKNK